MAQNLIPQSFRSLEAYTLYVYIVLVATIGSLESII